MAGFSSQFRSSRTSLGALVMVVVVLVSAICVLTVATGVSLSPDNGLDRAQTAATRQA